MLRGIYTAATGMIQQSRRLDTISNNLANVNTIGYKRDKVLNRSFEDELLLRTGGGQTSSRRIIGHINHGVYADEIVTSFEQGSLDQTYNETDVAILGEGFFTILTDDGVRYTRDGSFAIDNSGRLVTRGGWPVLGEQGDIYIYDDNYVLDEHGNIFRGEDHIDRLLLVDFENKETLRKTGDNIYINIDEENRPIQFNGELRQGFLEGSNVEPIKEIADMMAVTRLYETNQRIIKMMDDTLGKAVNEVGQV
ncbi:MAG: flagellar basal-body rod protein FlgF [Clostridiales bacterium]|nr:flagellar basal-body rod protein FlgF [Clostridiales bacterium]